MPNNFSKSNLRRQTIEQLNSLRASALSERRFTRVKKIDSIIVEKQNGKFFKRYSGRKTRDWTNERNRQRKVSLESNLMYCQFQFEGCEVTENLGYSHPFKRRKTTDLSFTVLACSKCHRFLEDLKPQSEKTRLHQEALDRQANLIHQGV